MRYILCNVGPEITKMANFCSNCARPLSEYNPGHICIVCQKEIISGKDAENTEVCYDALDFADILGLKSAEQVRRLAREGKLPPRVPAIWKYLWLKEVVHSWMRSGYLEIDEKSRVILKAIEFGLQIDNLTLDGNYFQNLVDKVKKYEAIRSGKAKYSDFPDDLDL